MIEMTIIIIMLMIILIFKNKSEVQQ